MHSRGSTPRHAVEIGVVAHGRPVGQQSAERSADWLVGGGELGERIRSTSWSSSPLGPRDRWPQSLRTAVSLVVESKFPMALLWGPELALLYNDAYGRFAADKHPQALGRPAREIWSDAWHTREPILSAVMERGESLSFEDELLPIVGPRGGVEEACVTLCYSPVRTEGGAVGGALVTLHETTAARQRAEEQLLRAKVQLEEADRSKNDFLAMLSHELRNPLAPIRNSIHILGRTAPGGDQACRALGVIERQVDHMARLVDDLLDVTRVMRGKAHLQPERLELNALVQRTVEDHRGVFVANGVDLKLKVAPADLWVSGDRTRLAQVIGNLLQNAAKFTPKRGKTTVSVEADSLRRRAVVRVEDTGRGISQEMLPRLFDAFTQGDTTLDRSKGGLGLGLALVKGLMEGHGGSVTATSGGPSRGSTFTITLPVESATATAPSPRRPSSGPRARRVLVIEDNVDAADSLREALELRGHVVTVAYSGPEGLAKARAFGPDAVVCDIGLPEMDGYEVARAMRIDPMLRGAALVAMTGYARPEDVDKARAAGFDAHLAKPSSLSALDKVLAEVCSAPRGTAMHPE